MSDLLAAALDYAARGLAVFPCVPRGKTPAIARGFHSATCNPATIRRYWTDPDRNIAIPTGASSPSGCSTSTARKARRACAISRRVTEPFRKRAAWSLLAVVMRGLHTVNQSRRGPAGSVPASIRAVMAAISSCRHPSMKRGTATPGSAIPGRSSPPRRNGWSPPPAPGPSAASPNAPWR